MDSNDKRIAFFGISSKNFGGPYLSSPTWYRGRSVLKIIVWRSSLLTNIFQPLGKQNKATRASEMSKIENFKNFQILSFWTKKNIFWGAKGSKWMQNLNVTYNPLKICHWRGKLMKKLPIYSVFFIFSPFSAFLAIFCHFGPFKG